MSVDQLPKSSHVSSSTRGVTPRPVSTYRVQFHKGFTFTDAARIVPYLANLGISHVYASPYLQAAPGSTHGYDVVNPEALSAECGTQEDYRSFLDALRDHGMSHILDIVPNHMGVGTDQNPWWNNVLEFGISSPFASFFDIAWEADGDAAGKVVLPILGDKPAAVIGKGELKLIFDNDGFGLQYFNRRLPVTPDGYASILRKLPEFSAAINKLNQLPEPGVERHRQLVSIKKEIVSLAMSDQAKPVIAEVLAGFNSPDHRQEMLTLLNLQHYRLVFWRAATVTMNYRRFFDINDLAALRMDREEVFERTHASILQRLAMGEISGVRVDHPDGLADPKLYFQRLQSAYTRECARMATTVPAQRGPIESAVNEKPLYIVAEKILGFEETLDESWPIDGTTGYDFLAKLNAFFVNPWGKAPLSALYGDFTGCSNDFPALAFECKRFMLRSSFARELAILVGQIESAARHALGDQSPTHTEFDEAVAELIVHFPVYRTYLTEAEASTEDTAVIDHAISVLLKHQPDVSRTAVDSIKAILLNQGTFAALPSLRQQRWPIVRRFQQLTAPVTAKGVEDTAVYRFHRLISLNDVGCEPDRFGLSTEELHTILQERQQLWPNALSTLSTHDTKRSEDVRARLHVLADIPDRWRDAVRRWSKINASIWPTLDAIPLDTNTEYLLYQTLLGTWLPGMVNADESFVSRIIAYLQKATREAKLHTSWTDPDAEYESRFEKFVRALLDPQRSGEFLAEFVPFAQSLTRAGYLNSLAQTLVKLTAPGIPDTYQGTELWDFSLVDPDNRRPVDYELRARLLADATVDLGTLLAAPDDGRIKLHLTRSVLKTRYQFANTFQHGGYAPIPTHGERPEHLFAFAREDADSCFISAVPRFPGEWMPFRPDAALQLSQALLQGMTLHVRPSARYLNLLTSQRLQSDSRGILQATAVFQQLPVAFLMQEPDASLENRG